MGPEQFRESLLETIALLQGCHTLNPKATVSELLGWLQDAADKHPHLVVLMKALDLQTKVAALTR